MAIAKSSKLLAYSIGRKLAYSIKRGVTPLFFMYITIKIRMQKVVVVAPHSQGVSKYRFSDPYRVLAKTYKDDLDIIMMHRFDFEEIDGQTDLKKIVLHASFLVDSCRLSQKGVAVSVRGYLNEINGEIANNKVLNDIYNLVSSFNKQGKTNDKFLTVYEYLKIKIAQGIDVIIDIDDYWEIPETHFLYKTPQAEELKQIPKRLHIAKFVTTTTQYFAQKIKPFNKNVIVIPNGIDENDTQFIPNPEKSDRVRFGWAGGATHYYDLQLLTKIPYDFRDDNNIQLVLCGFDSRLLDLKTKKETEVAKPKIWIGFEKLFTNNYELVSEEYKHYLEQYKKEDYKYHNDERYRRIWSKPVQDYGKVYNCFDVALAPLVNNDFNNCKSQLKVIEAGFHKKPIIASDSTPYRIDVKNGKNGFLVQKRGQMGNFSDKIKYFMDNRNAIVDMGEKLWEDTRIYTLQNINKIRYQILTT